jgi:hypothetical protein
MSIDVNHIRGFRTRDSVTSESCFVTNYTKSIQKTRDSSLAGLMTQDTPLKS